MEHGSNPVSAFALSGLAGDDCRNCRCVHTPVQERWSSQRTKRYFWTSALRNIVYASHLPLVRIRFSNVPCSKCSLPELQGREQLVYVSRNVSLR